jgi:hypothetical protein
MPTTIFWILKGISWISPRFSADGAQGGKTSHPEKSHKSPLKIQKIVVNRGHHSARAVGPTSSVLNCPAMNL